MARISILLAIVMMGAAGCGREPVKDYGDFGGYVERFEQLSSEEGAPVKISDLVVRVGDLPNPRERGICEIGPGKPPTVTINRKSWAKLDDASRESLVFHELGHCVLFRKHKDGYARQGIPLSLMHPYSMDSEVFVEYEDYYLNELFSARNEL